MISGSVATDQRGSITASGANLERCFEFAPDAVIDNVMDPLCTALPQGFGEVQFVRIGQPGTEGSGQLLHYGLMHQGRAGSNGFNSRAGGGGGGGSLVVSVCVCKLVGLCTTGQM
jgi:hypothetical protein